MGNNELATTKNKKLATTENKDHEFSEEDIKFLFNELRKSSVIWDGRKECLRLASKKVFLRRSKTGKAIYKLHWQCAACHKWKKQIEEMEVDHIVEIGGYTEHTGDWNETIAKIFPRPVSKHLQALCGKCHLKKTNQYNSARTKWVRKERA